MIQFIVGALAVVGLSELAKSKKMPKMANGGSMDDDDYLIDDEENDNEIDVEIVQDKAYGKGYFIIRDYKTRQILHDSIQGKDEAYRIAEFENNYNVVYSEGEDEDEDEDYLMD